MPQRCGCNSPLVGLNQAKTGTALCHRIEGPSCTPSLSALGSRLQEKLCRNSKGHCCVSLVSEACVQACLGGNISLCAWHAAAGKQQHVHVCYFPLYLHMMVKHLLLGMGLIWHSVRALVMIVCIWPRKKRARSGLWAPGLDSTASTARLNYNHARR